MIRPTGASHAPERFSALRPPRDSGRVKRRRKPRTQKCAAGTSRCGLFEIVRLDYGERFGDEPRARSVCAEPPHPEERAQPASRRMGRRVPSCFETPRRGPWKTRVNALEARLLSMRARRGCAALLFFSCSVLLSTRSRAGLIGAARAHFPFSSCGLRDAIDAGLYAVSCFFLFFTGRRRGEVRREFAARPIRSNYGSRQDLFFRSRISANTFQAGLPASPTDFATSGTSARRNGFAAFSEPMVDGMVGWCAARSFSTSFSRAVSAALAGSMVLAKRTLAFVYSWPQ